MPPNRPLPGARTEQVDGSVTIDLNAPDPPPPGNGAAAPVKPTLFERRDRVPLGPAPEQPLEPPPDEGPDLEQQFADLKKREEAATKRATEERNQRLTMEQQARERINQTVQEKAQSDFYMVSNALAAKTAELEGAKNARMNALAQGDQQAAEEWNDRMLDLKLDIRGLTEGKAQMEHDLRRPPQPGQQRQPQVQQRPQNIEEALTQMPDLMEVERNWLRKHPDAVFNPRQLSRLQAAFLDWEDTKKARGTPEYFRFFNDRMGYENTDPEYDDVEIEREQPAMTQQLPQRSHPPARYAGGSMTAAPVSRISPGASMREAQNSGQVTLSPQQREAARFSGIDEKSYARNVQRLTDLKRRGYYQEVG